MEKFVLNKLYSWERRMDRKISFTTRLKRLFLGEVSSMAFCVGAISLLLALGFFSANSQTENYELINNHGSQILWGIIFLIYSVGRLASSLYRFQYSVRFFICFIGLTLWTLLLLSFTVYDPTPMRPTEVMLVLPVLCEFWLALSAVDCLKTKKLYRRATDVE